LEDRKTKWEAYKKDDIVWGMGISVIALKFLARTRAGK
jgi:hypothetical protein